MTWKEILFRFFINFVLIGSGFVLGFLCGFAFGRY